MVAIATTGLTKYYGGRITVENVALQVPEACVYGFVGPNGAGKTTVMRILLGLTSADRGTVKISGYDIASNRKAALAHVGAVIESPAMYGHLTGRANLLLSCAMLRVHGRDVDRVLDLVDLRNAADQKVGTYSLGMKQRLAVARTLLGSPRLLLLDEPTNGLDPDGIVAMRAFIRDLPDRIKGTVFISSHLLSEVEQIADHVGLMRNGRLVIQDKVANLIGTNANYTIDLDKPAQAVLVLKAAGFDAEQQSDQILLLCSHNQDAKKQAARANQILVEAGHAVSALSPRPTSLEDIYRGAVNRHVSEQRNAA